MTTTVASLVTLVDVCAVDVAAGCVATLLVDVAASDGVVVFSVVVAVDCAGVAVLAAGVLDTACAWVLSTTFVFAQAEP